MMRNIDKFSPIIADIQAEYAAYRTQGISRDQAICTIEADYAELLEDVEDNAAVMLGLAFSLCKKKELTESVYCKAISSTCQLKEILSPEDERYFILTEAEKYLGNTSFRGPEAVYRSRKPYIPSWETGDLFAHTLTHPHAKYLGIENWEILFYKVGEYQHGKSRIQLMYVSLCPPGQVPSSSEELQRIGFLRMMEHNDKWDYLVQISPRSAKDEARYQLTKIGNFPNVMPPIDRTDEDPFVSMPLFGKSSKDDIYPSFEEQICRIYRSNK